MSNPKVSLSAFIHTALYALFPLTLPQTFIHTGKFINCFYKVTPCMGIMLFWNTHTGFYYKKILKTKPKHKTTPEELCCLVTLYSQIITTFIHQLKMTCSFPILTSISTKHHLFLSYCFLLAVTAWHLLAWTSLLTHLPLHRQPCQISRMLQEPTFHILFWEYLQVNVKKQQITHKSNHLLLT